jgi:hypothetical protein
MNQIYDNVQYITQAFFHDSAVNKINYKAIFRNHLSWPTRVSVASIVSKHAI